MADPLSDVLKHLLELVDVLDRAAVAAFGAQTGAEGARTAFTEAGRGSANPLITQAATDARTASDAARDASQALGRAARAYAAYINTIAPGTAPTRQATAGSMPTGEQLLKPASGGALSKRILARAMIPNFDDGLEGLQTGANRLQDAAPPGDVVVPRPPTPTVNAANTEGAHLGDALLAALTIAIVGIRASESVRRLRERLRARSRKNKRGRNDG